MKQEEREVEGEARYNPRDTMIQSMHYLTNIANYPLSLAMHRQQEIERQSVAGNHQLSGTNYRHNM